MAVVLIDVIATIFLCSLAVFFGYRMLKKPEYDERDRKEMNLKIIRLCSAIIVADETHAWTIPPNIIQEANNILNLKELAK